MTLFRRPNSKIWILNSLLEGSRKVRAKSFTEKFEIQAKLGFRVGNSDLSKFNVFLGETTRRVQKVKKQPSKGLLDEWNTLQVRKTKTRRLKIIFRNHRIPFAISSLLSCRNCDLDIEIFERSFSRAIPGVLEKLDAEKGHLSIRLNPFRWFWLQHMPISTSPKTNNGSIRRIKIASG